MPIAYSFPYILLFVFINIIHLNSNVSRESKKTSDFLLYAVLVFFFCFQGYVGRDWPNYFIMHKNIPDLLDIKSFDWFYNKINNGMTEPGFNLYLSITKTVFQNYLAWSNFDSLVQILLLTVIMKEYNIDKKGVFFLLFLIFGGMAFVIDALRNSKAIYIFIISVKYLRERNFLAYLALNILGCLFHISAVLYIPFYFIANLHINRFILFLLVMGGYAVLFTKTNIFYKIFDLLDNYQLGRISSLISGYKVTSKNIDDYGGGAFGIIERMATFIILFMTEKELYKRFKTRIFINAMYLYLLIFLYCSGIAILAERLPLLFIFSYWFIYTELYTIIKQKGVFLSLLLIYSILKCISAWSNPQSLYENVLFGHMNIDDRARYVEMNKNEQ